jgi:hypothetical protein
VPLSEDLNFWAQQLLESRGALVEAGGGGEFRTLLTPDVAQALHAHEWLQLRFGAGAGADDSGEWLDRLGVLLPGDAQLTVARLAYPEPVLRFDAEAVLARELVLTNGVFRLLEHQAETALYLFFSFAYEAESTDRTQGLLTVALNSCAQSIVTMPERLLEQARDRWVDDPGGAPDSALAVSLPVALRLAESQAAQFRPDAR